MAIENPLVASGLRKFSKRTLAKRTRIYLCKKNKVVTPKKAAPAPVVREATIKGGKKVQLKEKVPRYAPVDACEVRAANRAHSVAPISLRKSITPGTVLIVVAGRFAGKRVVFLKQLTSGLLLITGKYSPRLDHRTTSSTRHTMIIKATTKKSEGEFFKDGEKKTEKKEKKQLPEARVADQKAVDAAILAALKGQKELCLYLKTKFFLRSGEFPHALKF
ncbi:hypothetical protein SAMD00019534_121500 [Acytostelium subglobosum LB1]|uniref:hypothetical protein n=1 Tax=Acytostelium subglobosum LB1 TaxID=1410327 RepID=UPI0006448091|nr:hypothetical protein SAMD00019534_121500 [Acytostelium subglobosum LB1]GAM28974.1 hypothetical protein SAMD00019534_121500 [Acytostelium subglobosum LB1]|eukprot:XP_012748159.1 hypothetical protein SAMD00019534_121500 [Acytostelium subglobosum LB1]